jgi:hypothetical protein
MDRMKRAAVTLVIALLAGCDPAPPAPPPVPGKIPPPAHIRVQHVLVAFRGSRDAGARVTRTREEAEVLAQEILERARKGEDFKKLMREYSDDIGKGEIGLVSPGTRPRGPEKRREGFVAGFPRVAFTLAVGEVGLLPYDPSESPFGFHVIKRVE